MKLKFWSKTFGSKTLERIYVNSDKLMSGDKLFIERDNNNIIDGVKYGEDWKTKLNTDSFVYYSAIGYNDKLSIAEYVLEDFNLNDMTFDEIRKICN